MLLNAQRKVMFLHWEEPQKRYCRTHWCALTQTWKCGFSKLWILPENLVVTISSWAVHMDAMSGEYCGQWLVISRLKLIWNGPFVKKTTCVKLHWKNKALSVQIPSTSIEESGSGSIQSELNYHFKQFLILIFLMGYDSTCIQLWIPIFSLKQNKIIVMKGQRSLTFSNSCHAWKSKIQTSNVNFVSEDYVTWS